MSWPIILELELSFGKSLKLNMKSLKHDLLIGHLSLQAKVLLYTFQLDETHTKIAQETKDQDNF